jgi:hypothetical protein
MFLSFALHHHKNPFELTFVMFCLQNCILLLQFALSSYLNLLFYVAIDISRSRGSSVSIVSDHGLDDLAIGVRSPAGAKDLSSNLCVQTGSEAHPASCTMGTWGPFPGAASAIYIIRVLKEGTFLT